MDGLLVFVVSAFVVFCGVLVYDTLTRHKRGR